MRFDIPASVSPEAAASMRQIYPFFEMALAQKSAPPHSVQEWDALNARLSAIIGQMSAQTIARLEVELRDDVIDGIAVVRFVPVHRKSTRVLLFLHGGGYTLFSPRSNGSLAAMMAVAMGCEVIGVDYTLAPRGRWDSVPAEVERVYRALLDSGVSAAAVGVFGDSAGGGLAAASMLRWRDQGLPLPGALVLMSPWCDLTGSGDSVRSLAGADPSLEERDLIASAAAYAPLEEERRHPYASPLFGDYTRPVPPTLIQAGTREILLSDAVRLYQAMRSGGALATLDVYDGMPHVFQSMLPMAAESATAIARAARFFEDTLAAQ